MAWNGSDKMRSASSHRTPPQKNAHYRLVLIVLSALVVLSVFFYVCIDSSKVDEAVDYECEKVKSTIAKKRNTSPSNKKSRITKDLKPVTSEIEYKDYVEPSPIKSTDSNTTNNIIINDGSHRPPDRYSVLKLNCDKQIAGLLYAIPGQVMIGTVDFGEDFEKQFLESLKTRLSPSEDATDEEREMIEAVNEAKDIIVKTMREEGKTAGEVLQESRAQMRKFGEYKQMLQQELRRYEADEEKTDEDVSDLFDAANKMLTENGIEPFSPNDLTREVVRQYKFDLQENEEK
jgi:hypothetical protein